MDPVFPSAKSNEKWVKVCDTIEVDPSVTAPD